MEARGLRVGIIEIDWGIGVCTFRAEANGEGVPVIVTRRGLAGDRQRFRLAFELGHLLLDDGAGEEAHARFARAVLAPEAAVRQAVGETRRRAVTLDELHGSSNGSG